MDRHPETARRGSRSIRDPIATLIRALRTRRGLSLLAFGKRVRTSAPHLYNIEAGRKLPSEELAGRIGRELGLDPDAFRAWVRAAGRSDWSTTREATLRLDQFIRDPEVAELLSESGFEDGPPAMAVRISAALPGPAPRLDRAAGALPRVPPVAGGPARVLVPVIEPADDPERAREGRDTVLRLDPAALSGFESLGRPFAYALAPGRFPRAGAALPATGYAVLTRDPGWPPRDGAIYAARHDGGIELAPAMWNGTHLLLLPAPGHVDFVALPVAEEPIGREVLRGRVVLVVS
jgi:transcriptional regulator with XRE-family HTH domain